MKSLPRLKTPCVLSQSLHRQISSYALAASAAGVSLLALTQSSEARVVYTKTHQVIRRNGVYELDLNHDGIIDFLIQEDGANDLLAQAALGNSVLGSTTNSGGSFAAALTTGSPIGPGQGFLKGKSPGDVMVNFWTSEGNSGTSGHWWNVTRRYLGLKIKIDGKVHYGWARLNVKTIKRRHRGFKITATLTGYAYETVPKKGILAGQTAGNDSADESANSGANPFHPAEARPAKRPPASLGALALGAQLVPFGRRPL